MEITKEDLIKYIETIDFKIRSIKRSMREDEDLGFDIVELEDGLSKLKEYIEEE